MRIRYRGSTLGLSAAAQFTRNVLVLRGNSVKQLTAIPLFASHMQSKVNTIVVGSLTKRHDWSKRATSVCLEQLWCPHIAHSPHSSPTNQPTPYPIHISCALQIFNVIKLRDANFAADAAAYKSSTRRQKRQRAKSPKGPQFPPYSFKTAKATAASKIALNSPKKKNS